MRLLKMMAILAVITSVGLVGCNKDKNEVEVTPTLELGTYNAVSFEATNCDDASDNESHITDCATEDCVYVNLKENMTFDVLMSQDGEAPEVMFEGDYTINEGLINLDYSKSTGVEQLFEGPIIANNKFQVMSIDPDTGCSEMVEYVK